MAFLRDYVNDILNDPVPWIVIPLVLAEARLHWLYYEALKANGTPTHGTGVTGLAKRWLHRQSDPHAEFWRRMAPWLSA